MNKESQAILIFCSHLCIGNGITPFKPSEWQRLADLLLEKNLTPSNLLDMSTDEIISSISCDQNYALRIQKLTNRSASLFFEISKYANIGINLITRADNVYPKRLKQKLGKSCPPFFFYTGNLKLLDEPCLGFVGSRDMDEPDIAFETSLVEDAITNGYTIVSGGARGADTVSEKKTLSQNGHMIEFLSDSMLKKLHSSQIIKAIHRNDLLLLSVTNPDSSFSVGAAMQRNKYIYAQSKATIAVKSINQGGTWSGVLDNLKNFYCPVYCWKNEKYADNLALIEKGAIAIDETWSTKNIMTEEEFNSKKPIKWRQATLFPL